MSRIIRFTLLAAALSLLVASPSNAQAEEFVVPLSAPDQPAILEVQLSQGGLVIEGFDGNQVVVESRPVESEDEIEEVDGMFRIPNNSVGLTIEEKDNTVSIGTDWTGSGVNLKVKVPRRTSLRVQITNGEDLVISGVSGEHELKNVNGSIEARDMSGSVVANASNGDLTVAFLEISKDTPMSFVSWNGDIDVTFPSSLQATLKLQAGQGDILTDFDVELQASAPARTEEKRGKGYRVELTREVTGTVGGGGPEMSFKTLNGDVLVRKAGG
jgi:DUF4097 and DUF4098 domain-containing protein YvlB